MNLFEEEDTSVSGTDPSFREEDLLFSVFEELLDM